MAVAGRVLIKFRGNYDSTVSYSPLDAVFYPEENSTYVCTQLSLGNLPTNTTYWQIMAKGLSSVDPEDIGFGYGTCTTASDTDAKIVTLADYVLTVNGFVAVSFTNAVNANATLNINNQGARPIYNKGVAIEDEVIEAGDTAAFVYDGTHYNLITSSGSSGHIIQGPAGTDIAKEKRMQFIDAGVTDDSINGKTKVEVIQRVTSAQYVNAPDGIYDVYDDPGTSIDLNQLGDVNINTPLDGQGLVYDYDTDEWKNTTITPDLTSETETGNPLSFTTDSEQVAQNTVITFEPIQAGSGDPSPSNPRAINGYDVANAKVVKKNLWDKGNVSGTTYKDVNISLPAGTYTISALVTSNDTDRTNCRVRGYTIYSGGGESVYLDRDNKDSKTITFSESIKFLRFYASTNNEYSAGDTFTFADIQIELGDTATAYETPVVATDISESLPETLYSGTLDVESGKLVVTHKIYDLGDATWDNADGNLSSTTALRDVIKKVANNNVVADLLCSIYTKSSRNNIANSNNQVAVNSNGTVVINDSRISGKTGAEIATLLSGVMLVYELATPIEITLPAHSVKLLSGANVVTTNGTSMSLTYRNGEVAKLSDLGALAEGINGLAEASKGNLKFLRQRTLTVTADGVKTNSALLDELHLALVNYLATKGTNYCFTVINSKAATTGTTSISAFYPDASRYFDKTFNGGLNFTGIDIDSTRLYNYLTAFRASGSNSLRALYNGTSWTITDYANNVPNNGSTTTLTINEYELV